MAFEVYDDVAFFWFLLTLVFVILVPFTFHMISFFRVGQGLEKGEELLTSIGKQKRERMLKEAREAQLKKIFSIKTAVFVLMWIGFIVALFWVSDYQHEQLATFDPYEVLGLETGAAEQDIKKAYRRLSLKYHPDKNPGDEKAAQMFHRLSKAHMILTDEASRENWEKYGNPDGYRGASVTIGLPAWLLNPNNELKLLVFYFLVIVVLPPIGVGLWWRKNSRIHETGVYISTIQLFWYKLTENLASGTLLEVLSLSEEFHPQKRWLGQDSILSLSD